MKKIIIAILFLVSFKGVAQDTTVIINQSLQARLIEYLTPYLREQAARNIEENTADDARPLNGSYAVFLKWRAKFKATQPTGTTAVVTDTIPVVILANLYNYTLTNPDGLGVSAIMKTQIAASRAANSYLNRLCTAYEDAMTALLIELRITGRRYLLGKNLVP